MVLGWLYIHMVRNYTNIQMHACMFIRCFSDCAVAIQLISVPKLWLHVARILNSVYYIPI